MIPNLVAGFINQCPKNLIQLYLANDLAKDHSARCCIVVLLVTRHTRAISFTGSIKLQS